MKKLILVLMIICLAGCAGAPAKPPTGCENSLVWKSGFMPDGQELVELGFAALLTADPSLMPQVKDGAIKAWRLAKDGTLKGAVTELLDILNKVPQCAPLALFALSAWTWTKPWTNATSRYSWTCSTILRFMPGPGTKTSAADWPNWTAPSSKGQIRWLTAPKTISSL